MHGDVLIAHDKFLGTCDGRVQSARYQPDLSRLLADMKSANAAKQDMRELIAFLQDMMSGIPNSGWNETDRKNLDIKINARLDQLLRSCREDPQLSKKIGEAQRRYRAAIKR